MAGGTVLVAVPHPDDVELSCAATIARWMREGNLGVLLVATDGALGGKFPDSEQSAMVEQRREEQRQAAEIIGLDDVIFLGFADGSLRDDRELREVLVEHIRRIRPDRAVILDPLTVIYRNSYVNHRDHRMLGIAMLDALYPEASNAGYYPEQLARGLETHKVPEVWLANTDYPNYWVDVSETLDLRFEALRRHRSQMRLWPEQGEAIIRQQRELATVLGLEHGVGHAEEFRRVVVNPLS